MICGGSLKMGHVGPKRKLEVLNHEYTPKYVLGPLCLISSSYIYIYIYGHPPHDPIVCFIHQKALEKTVFLLHTLLQKCDPKILKKVIDKTYRKQKTKKPKNQKNKKPKSLLPHVRLTSALSSFRPTDDDEPMDTESDGQEHLGSNHFI